MPDDVCDRALHAALRRLEAERRWLWLQNVNATLTADVAGSVIDLPATIQSVNSLAYLTGTTGYDVLTAQPLASVRQAARSTVTGYPDAYCFTPGKLYLDNAVAAASSFEIAFSARTVDDIAATVAAPPATLSLKQNAVLAAACADAALGYLKNEAEAARQEARYTRFLDTLMDEEDEARTDEWGGGIVPDTELRVAAFGMGALHG